MMCSGASFDEVLFHVHGSIERAGWAVVPVSGDRRTRSWAYTIGLVELGHPELAVVGLRPESAGHLLNSIGDMVLQGHRFTAGGTSVGFRDKDYRFADVAPKHFVEDTFALWVAYYGALGEPRPEPRALEVIRSGLRPKLADP